jgi:hypothetical protein
MNITRMLESVIYLSGCVLLFGLGIAASVFIAYKMIFKGDVTITQAVAISKDFLLYKLREKVSDVLETGKITINKDNNNATVTYFRGEDKFKILIPVKRGLKPIKDITLKPVVGESLVSNNSKELLKLINEYAGPSRDFHGVHGITPSLLGINQPIVVTYSNGVVKEYDVSDIIGVALSQ